MYIFISISYTKKFEKKNTISTNIHNIQTIYTIMSVNPKIFVIEKTTTDAAFEKKRRRVEKTFKDTTKVLVPNESVATSCLTLNVQSSDKTNQYPVNIKYDSKGITFECSCGDQFGMSERRNTCKHVATAILEMNKCFLDNHVVDGKIKTINKDTISEIVNLLEQFDLD